MEIKDIKNNLDLIRKSPEMWNEFAYLRDKNSGEDANYMKRYALAIELQYNWNPDDYELVKFLMENEIMSRRKAPFQGIGNSLILISYLLAKFRNPENVWLFDKAKCANFDTFCGYDSEFIFSAGVEATCNYLESHDITEDYYLFEIRDHLRSIHTEDDIERFFERMEQMFPDRIEEESIETLLERAIFFEDYKEGERLFRLLEKEGESSDLTLYYYAKDLKNYDKAVYYLRKHMETTKTSLWNQVSLLLRLAKLYCLKGDYISAFEISNQLEQMQGKLSGWKKENLCKSLMETWFDISLGLYGQNNRKLGSISFEKADHMLKKLKNHTLYLLEKANVCCEKFGTLDQQSYYKRLLEAEKKSIEEEIKRIEEMSKQNK